MNYLFNPANSDVKSRIIYHLAIQYPLSAKAIYAKVSKNCTYQYVHKCLKQLVDMDVLSCENKNYQLNPKWLKDVKKFIDVVDETYELDYKIISHKTNKDMMDLFTKKEWDEVQDEINQVLAQKATAKLETWYSGFYDPENKEFEYIRSIAKVNKADILEIGCGTGRITRALIDAGATVTALDRNPEFIDFCNKKFDAEFLTMDIRDIGSLITEGRTYDTIITGWIGLHYFDLVEQKRVCNLFRRLLKPGGKILIIESYHNCDYVKILDMLIRSKNHIKEKVQNLKETIIEEFGDTREQVVMTYYKFDSFDELKFAFKVEVQYEHRMRWTSRMESDLKAYVNQLDDPLIISEAPLFLVTQ